MSVRIAEYTGPAAGFEYKLAEPADPSTLTDLERQRADALQAGVHAVVATWPADQPLHVQGSADESGVSIQATFAAEHPQAAASTEPGNQPPADPNAGHQPEVVPPPQA